MQFCDLPSEGEFRHLLIAGIRPKKPEEFRQAIDSLSSSASVQILNSKAVAGFEHIMTAALLTAKSWAEGRNLAHSPATEILLYASAKRQIKEAIASVGVNIDSAGWIIIAVSDSQSKLVRLAATLGQYGAEADGLMDLTEGKSKEIMERYGITEEELRISEQLVRTKELALKSLVMERVALSELYR